MRSKYRKKTKVIKNENIKYKNFLVHTIMVFLCIFPFCVYSHVEQLSELAQKYFPNTKGYTADFFLYHKEKLLFIFAVWLLLFFVGEHIYPEHPIRDIPLRRKTARVTLILIGIYAVCILLSALFSIDKATALWGSCTEYEGIAALFGYLVLFLAGYNYFQSDYHRKILKRGITVLITAICVLALVEFFCGAIYEMGFMKYLIAPEEYRDMAASLSNKEFSGKVTLSFYNPGYLGGLCAMLLPISFGFAFEEEKVWKKCLYLLLAGGLMFTLLGAGSTGPFLAAVAGMFLLFFCLRVDRKQLLLTTGYFFCVLAGIFFLTNMMTKGGMMERFFSVATNQSGQEQQKERFAVTYMELKGRTLEVSTGKHSFQMEEGVSEYLVLETLKFTDENGEEIQTSIDEDGVLYLLGDGYKAVKFTHNGTYLSMELGYDDTVDFYVTEEGFFLVGQNGVALAEIPQSEIKSEFLKELYPIATGRGYMWINTLPILKECLVIGKGPGNFVYAFPQNEVVGLLNTHGSCKFVVDKPHSWYLQIAVNTGVLSLVCVLGLMFRYIKGGIKDYCIRKKNEKKEFKQKESSKETGVIFEKALWAGLTAFCITGLVNDSIVAVNPVFWLLFGVGSCAVDNRRNKERSGG